MKKALLLLLFPISLSAQYVDTYSNIQTLKASGQLVSGMSYMITDLGKMEIMAKSVNDFFPIPVKRTPYAMEYDEELFDFDTKVITGIDNISCVARCNGAWFLLNDGTHKPYKAAYCTNNLMVWYGKTYDKVYSASTCLDDTYSGSNLDITCGASVSLQYIAIWVHKNVNGVKTQMTLAEASIPGSNIFINVRMGKIIQL